MILVLLRTGMRIGELLATRVSEVDLRDKRILIMEAQKTRIGRVVYLSEDACRALSVWLKMRDPEKALSVLWAGATKLELHGGTGDVRQKSADGRFIVPGAIVCIVSGIPVPANC